MKELFGKRTRIVIFILSFIFLFWFIPAESEAAIPKSAKTKINHILHCRGLQWNWDGVSDVSQFIGKGGQYCFAYVTDDYVNVVKTKKGKLLRYNRRKETHYQGCGKNNLCQ